MDIDSHSKEQFKNNYINSLKKEESNIKRISQVKMGNAQGVWIPYGALLTMHFEC